MTEAAEHERRTRARQLRVLRAIEARLERGDGVLPIDVAAPIERELELRLDDEAVAEAWTEQGGEEAEPWTSVRDRLLE